MGSVALSLASRVLLAKVKYDLFQAGKNSGGCPSDITGLDTDYL